MIPIRRRLYQSLAGFTPQQLFAALQGAWYEPTTDTCFTDTAGTTPAALGQAVARINDRSGRSNNATQATAANRPTLSARYNLLTYSEQFDNAAWTKYQILAFGSGSIANAVVAPNGTQTAELIVPNTVNNAHAVWLTSNISVNASSIYTCSIYVKKAGYSWVFINANFNSNYRGVSVNLDTGVISKSSSNITATSENAGNGWYKVTIRITVVGSNGSIEIWPLPSDILHPESAPVAFSGDGISGVYLWGADIRLASTPSGIPPYQRIAAATDYDTTGFPVRLVHDATDVLTASLPALSGGNYSITASIYFATNVGMSALHGQTIGTTYNLPALNADVYGWVITPERLSAVNEARLERYMLRLANLPQPDYLLDSSDNQLTADDGELLLRA